MDAGLLGLRRQGVYVFRRGYWGPHVGFYGGVNYGFGYTGRGYEGGRWEGQRFFYNTAVNNIRTTQVTTVYNAPVVVNNVTTINRVSYNGGAGGVAAAANAAGGALPHRSRIFRRLRFSGTRSAPPAFGPSSS